MKVEPNRPASWLYATARASLEGLMRWFCCNKAPGSRLHLCFVSPLGHLISAATVCCTVSQKPAYITTGVQLLMPFITFCVSLFSSLLSIIRLVKWVEGCWANPLLLCSFSRSCQGRNRTSYQFQKIDVPCDFCMDTRMNDMWGLRLCPWYSHQPRKAARDAQSSSRCLSTCSGSSSPAYVSSRRTRWCDPICLFHSPRTNSTPANWVKLYIVVAPFQVPLVREKNYFSILGCNWTRCSTKPQQQDINFCLWRTLSRWPGQAYLSLVYLMYFFLIWLLNTTLATTIEKSWLCEVKPFSRRNFAYSRLVILLNCIHNPCSIQRNGTAPCCQCVLNQWTQRQPLTKAR